MAFPAQFRAILRRPRRAPFDRLPRWPKTAGQLLDFFHNEGILGVDDGDAGD